MSTLRRYENRHAEIPYLTTIPTCTVGILSSQKKKKLRICSSYTSFTNGFFERRNNNSEKQNGSTVMESAQPLYHLTSFIYRKTTPFCKIFESVRQSAGPPSLAC
eukprot:gnl/MRDRNA2_/MRDRNA2_169178_c0_seq1.p1 gnl/MRDRNA2_/MRDRNA2_169178_c0~~gnl/MRDRNA2_/MRDRNA2_169178_c0_seq1.p1  ORF type:complete len:105 (-),score=1.33 gnl/MRDRNA2_/MRDRNA2_169178_c0_seq1:84-398(-)